MPLQPMRVLLNGYNAFLGRAENIRTSYNALKQITTEHERIHAGKAYIHNDIHSPVAQGDYEDHIIIADRIIHLRAYDVITDQGPGKVSLREDPFLDPSSLGILSYFRNANRGHTDPSSINIWINPFIDAASNGLILSDINLPFETGANVKSASQSAITPLVEWVLKANTPYLISYVNSSVNVATPNPSIFVYETGD